MFRSLLTFGVQAIDLSARTSRKMTLFAFVANPLRTMLDLRSWTPGFGYSCQPAAKPCVMSATVS